jgi:hypothetical protein
MNPNTYLSRAGVPTLAESLRPDPLPVEALPASVKLKACPAGGWRVTANGNRERVW